MPVLKNKTQGQYVNVYKEILKNPSLNLRDRGMVVTLLSLPDNWDFNIAGLAKILPDGKCCIRASLDRLEQLGYLTKEQDRTEKGTFGRNILEIHETPLSGFLLTGNQVTDKPTTVNRTQYNNNKLNNKECITNQSINHQCEEDGMIDDIAIIKDLIAENIRLNDFYEIAGDRKAEMEMIREIYDTICDVVCFPRETMVIKGTTYPWQVVKAQFMKLKSVHISNLLGRLIDNRLEIKNMEAYLVSTLYSESISGTLKDQADLHDDYLRYLRGNPYENMKVERRENVGK